ncbi:serine hydrolase RBBP9-like [Asterias rubens]|uniref:serine hydrolase RBBP9-like n=1 Tax=Asterias rubens TaxID=7604 RepID=UPI001454F1A7|nr:serine hydrolase RBBP9-like [Asterias rubens]
MATRVVIVPGNGCGQVEQCNWYAWARDEINKKYEGVECILRPMPDPDMARESIWIPFMRDELCCDEQTLIIGDCSGSEATMRFVESYKVHSIILVSPCVTDLGEENEKLSGYYDRPWEWAKMRSNTQSITVFGSTDDPYIKWAEMQEVIDNLNPELHKFHDRGHFEVATFPELIPTVGRRVHQK